MINVTPEEAAAISVTMNNSVMLFVEQGFDTLGESGVSFWIKVLALFGFFYLFHTLSKTGWSLVELLVYVYAFFKWVVFKIRRKDI